MNYRPTIAIAILCLVTAFTVPTLGQDTASIPSTPTVDEKSQQIIDHAIQVLGGQSYLNINSVVGKGYYTVFNQGVSQIPAKFLDYIVYPDRERTEFIGGGIKTIQTNVGNTGWLYDGGPKAISDQGPTQIEGFKLAIRTTMENLLRGTWKKEGGKIVYVGRREAGLAKRNETIRLTFPNGFWIEYEFGAKDFLPAKVIYKRTRKNPDTGDEQETSEEDRFFKFITVDGITAPWVIDHFTEGNQTSRINYESIVYNQKVPDALFAKPDNVKAIK